MADASPVAMIVGVACSLVALVLAWRGLSLCRRGPGAAQAREGASRQTLIATIVRLARVPTRSLRPVSRASRALAAGLR